MAVQKKKFWIISIFAIVFMAIGIFAGCSSKPVVTSSGYGQVIESKNEEGDNVYTAVADPWNDFLGWYEGGKLYSSEEEIALSPKSSKKIKAVFASSGEITINRFLNGIFNNISCLEEKEYLNFDNSFNLNIINANENKNYKIQTAGSLAITGEENIVKIIIKDNENAEKLNILVKNNLENSKIYLKIDENKYIYDFPAEFKKIDMPEMPPSLQSLSDQMYEMAENILGYQNTIKFIEKVENKKNEASLTFAFDKLLDFAKNIVLPNLTENDVWLKEIIETFTKKYQGIGRTLPEMKCSLLLDFEGEGQNETFAGMRGNLILADDYKLELEDVVTIEKGTIDFNLENFSFEMSETPVDVQLGEGYNQINPLNLSLEGQIEFLEQQTIYTNQYDVLDTYKLSLHSNINSFALENAISGQDIEWSKIDWANFGYLNLRLSLVETGESSQLAKHNNATDYVNVLIDSDKFGANALVYAAGYNPKMNLIAENHIINNTFHLPKLMETYSSGLEGAFPEEDKTMNMEIIINALKGTISFVLYNDRTNLNDVLYKFLEGVMSGSGEDADFLKENFFFQNEKIMLKLDDVKNVINENMTNFSSWLGYSNFNNNLLGQNTTHLSFDFSKLEYGNVDSETKTADLELYNQKHKTLLALAEDNKISGIDDYDFTANADYKTYLSSLIGKDRTLTGLFSDGKTSSTIDDYKENGKTLTLTIYEIDIIEEGEGRAKIAIYFTYTQGTFAQTLYNKNIPYGLIVCEREIDIK
ncbi:MAG: hypothetical protein J6K97_02355 [Clostridia bacterium]|nr:hypothetical protein [Clostridia bacterium]